MKFKNLFFLAAGLAISSTCLADISVNFPQNCEVKSLDYYFAPIKQYASAKSRSERGIVADSIKVENSKAIIAIPTEADSYLYSLIVDNNEISLYVVPGENIEINVTSCKPFNYNMRGSAIVDGMNDLNVLTTPINAKAQDLEAGGNPDPEAMEQLAQQYMKLHKEFIENNPTSPAAPAALLNLEGEEFLKTYDAMPESFNNSILTPLIVLQYEREKKNVELDKKQKAMQEGDVEAPGFTLKNLEGKYVSLSDFKGKWVILDFWGSWCPWCIKGFPELKEAYEKYAGKLEIIGIDCRESEAEWRAGVEKYQLPWVNVYNPENSPLLSEYGVQGFPTKAIIDPDGKIANITVGHDPSFFTVLGKLLGE